MGWVSDRTMDHRHRHRELWRNDGADAGLHASLLGHESLALLGYDTEGLDVLPCVATAKILRLVLATVLTVDAYACRR